MCQAWRWESNDELAQAVPRLVAQGVRQRDGDDRMRLPVVDRLAALGEERTQASGDDREQGVVHGAALAVSGRGEGGEL